MDKTEFITIYPTFQNLDVVRQTLPTIIAETSRNDARLIVHDCSLDSQPEKVDYLRDLSRHGEFFLVSSHNMSMAQSRNLCLGLAEELFAPDYICLVEDDHGFRDGLIPSMLEAMKEYYGKPCPNGLRYGMFTGCTKHTHAELITVDERHSYPSPASKPFQLGGSNNCFRCAPSSHWRNVLKGYDTDEYLISEYQTSGVRWRNYHKGFTVMYVGGGAGVFDAESKGRGLSSEGELRLWDSTYCASDPRSRFRGKEGMSETEIADRGSKSLLTRLRQAFSEKKGP